MLFDASQLQPQRLEVGSGLLPHGGKLLKTPLQIVCDQAKLCRLLAGLLIGDLLVLLFCGVSEQNEQHQERAHCAQQHRQEGKQRNRRSLPDPRPIHATFPTEAEAAPSRWLRCDSLARAASNWVAAESEITASSKRPVAVTAARLFSRDRSNE